MPVHEEVLPNGLRLVLADMPHLHSLEMVCYVGAGGRNETAELSGISHFVEHMLFRGCEGYDDSISLERAFEALGGAVNATTDADTTCFFSRLHPERLAEGADLFARLLCKPQWNAIETERRIILEEAREDLNEAGEVINSDTLTNALLWPDHPLGRPLIGSESTLRKIALPQLQQYHRSYYSPRNVLVAVAGKLPGPRSCEAFREAFTSWRGPEVPAPLPASPLPEQGRPQSCWVHDSSSQLNLQFALQIPWGRSHPDSFALRIWRRILSWGGTSRLMLRLREELGLTYHVEAGLNMLSDTGCLTVDLAVPPERLLQAVEEVLSLLLEMGSRPVAEEELQRTLRNFRYDLDYSRDLPEELAVRYGWGTLVGYRRSFERDLADAEALTGETLQRVACQLLVPGRLALAVVGPWRTADRPKVEAMLEHWA